MSCPSIFCIVSDEAFNDISVVRLLPSSDVDAREPIIVIRAVRVGQEWSIRGTSAFQQHSMDIYALHHLSDTVIFCGRIKDEARVLAKSWSEELPVGTTSVMPAALHICELERNCSSNKNNNGAIAMQICRRALHDLEAIDVGRHFSTVVDLPSSLFHDSPDEYRSIVRRVHGDAVRRRTQSGRRWSYNSLDALLAASSNSIPSQTPHPARDCGLDVQLQREVMVLTKDPSPDREAFASLCTWACMEHLIGSGSENALVALILAHHATTSQHWAASSWRTGPPRKDNKCTYENVHWKIRYEDLIVSLVGANETTSEGLCCEEVQVWWAEYLDQFTDARDLGGADPAVHERAMTGVYAAELLQKPFLRRALQARAPDARCDCCVFRYWYARLPCHHSLCKPCLQYQSYGLDDDLPHQLTIKGCPICAVEFDGVCSLSVIPPLATPRVLSLDGGGVKGVVQLLVLQALQEEIHLSIDIRRFFDLIVGTSIGGICAIGLARLGWSVSECISQFDTLIYSAFRDASAQTWRISDFMRSIQSACNLLFRDCRYDSRPVKDALSGSFGSNTTLVPFEPRAGQSQVAVIADNITTDLCEVLTSYNKASHQRKESYSWIADTGLQRELKCVEAAQATSAAPMYFRPLQLGANQYQDGAVKFNNPTPVGIQEARQMARVQSVFSVSVGCGRYLEQQNKTCARSIYRLSSILSHSMDAHQNHNKHELCRGNSDEAIFRLNPLLAMQDVGIDEVTQLSRLKMAVLATIRGDKVFRRELRRTAHEMIVSMFYLSHIDSGALTAHTTNSIHFVVMSRLTKREMKTMTTEYPAARLVIEGVAHKLQEMPVYCEHSLIKSTFSIGLTLGHDVIPLLGSPFPTRILTATDETAQCPQIVDVLKRKRSRQDAGTRLAARQRQCR